MGSTRTAPASPSGRGVVLAMIGWAGLAAGLTMVYLGMRAVMDIGGSCAEGGPYVVSRTCPEGSTAALFLGIFGGVAFAFLASVGGFLVGGIWAATPLLAWAALFGSLGWNFLEYGVFAPPGEDIILGWAIPGVMFWLMAFVPLLGLVPVMRAVGPVGRAGAGRRGGLRASGGAPEVTVLDGPGQPGRGPIVVSNSGAPVTTVSRDGRTITVTSAVLAGDDVPQELRAQLETLGEQLAQARRSGQTEASHQALTEIAADLGAAVTAAVAATPMGEAIPDTGAAPPGGPPGPEPLSGPPGPAPDPAPAAAAPGPGPAAEPEFTEGTQALLDRLERLADMRDRGLLGADEYETAKAAIMAELEGRS